MRLQHAHRKVIETPLHSRNVYQLYVTPAHRKVIEIDSGWYTPYAFRLQPAHRKVIETIKDIYKLLYILVAACSPQGDWNFKTCSLCCLAAKLQPAHRKVIETTGIYPSLSMDGLRSTHRKVIETAYRSCTRSLP